MTLSSPPPIADASELAPSGSAAGDRLDATRTAIGGREVAIGLLQVAVMGAGTALLGSLLVHLWFDGSWIHTQGFALGVFGATFGAAAALIAIMMLARLTGSLISAPMVGMVVRLTLTALPAVAAIQLLGVPTKVTAGGALVGYLLLMVLEVIWLYRLLSPVREAASPSPNRTSDEALKRAKSPTAKAASPAL